LCTAFLRIVDQTKQVLGWCYIGDEEKSKRLPDIFEPEVSRRRGHGAARNGERACAAPPIPPPNAGSTPPRWLHRIFR
jgi:hypothetical protein